MQSIAMWAYVIIVLVFYGHKGACKPLTDTWNSAHTEEFHANLPALLHAERSGKLLRLTLQQTVEAPLLSNPARLPECPKAGKLSKLLLQHINGTYGAMITGHLEVDTTYVQELQRCSYSTYIFFSGDAALKDMLVAAANAGPAQLCEALDTYCEKAFPKSSGYSLTASSAQRSPPLPPVLDFNCQKRHFDQTLDHFDRADQRSFKQTYWVCDDAWPQSAKKQAQQGSIIAFLGNESPLGTPSQPIVFEQARDMNALVLQVEHRYYGDSQPFPDNLQPDGMLNSSALYRWLSVEQVIEDTAAVLAAVRRELRVPAAVPAIVIGGSYGGMLATYHRVSKPAAFAAAIAASAPLSFMVGTQQWEDTSHRYHRIIAAAIDGNSGSPACGDAIRRGLAGFKRLGTAGGRQQLADTFNLCGAADAVLPDPRAVFALEMDQYGWFEGYAQVKNQPPLMGQVALACDVMTDVITKGGDELQALAAATTYFASNGSAGWCYDFNATLFMTGPSTYTYQSCTQGFPNTAMLPERHTRRHTLVPPYRVHHKELESECRQIFGQDLPRLKVPAVAADVKRLLREVGGVVFTNGEFDGWAGGSFLSDEDVWPAPNSAATRQQQQQQQWSGSAASQRLPPALSISRRLAAAGSASSSSSSSSSSSAAKAQVAFVSYKGASHCTDTHNLAVHSPGKQPASWARQRRRAMQYARQFADRQQRSMLLQESR